ncbi:MAG: hypothetical protein P8099_10170 [Gemmatimonadota bacterium]|jgi:hypothetical protein
MAGRGARVVVAATVLLVLLVAGWFTAASRAVFLMDAVLMVLAYGLPAWWIGHPKDVTRVWPVLLAWVLVLTVAWDAISAALGERPLLSEWWLVYPSSVIFFLALYLFHGWVAWVVTRRSSGRSHPSSPP